MKVKLRKNGTGLCITIPSGHLFLLGWHDGMILDLEPIVGGLSVKKPRENGHVASER